jgi:biotin transport system substrate-specific component
VIDLPPDWRPEDGRAVAALFRHRVSSPPGRRAIAVLGGALLVALGAQLAVPLPGTPVPLTLQVPAVLIVGALLGPGLGAASMVAYLAAGAVGLPVFAPGGVPGLARLFGPTGGYLLAFPLAAACVAHLAGHGRPWGRLMLGLVAGLAAVHAGGVAQLVALHADWHVALRLGSLPFLLHDALKLLFAALVIRRLAPTTRALL